MPYFYQSVTISYLDSGKKKPKQQKTHLKQTTYAIYINTTMVLFQLHDSDASVFALKDRADLPYGFFRSSQVSEQTLIGNSTSSLTLLQ